MQLERINCPICGSGENREKIRSKDFRYNISVEYFSIVECKKCGFLFLNPRPRGEEAFKFYPSYFYTKDKSVSYKLIEPIFAKAHKSIIKLFKKYKNNGRSLDIGCGNGIFVSAMLEGGFDAWGVEPNSEAERFVDKHIKGRILFKDLKDCAFEGERFDVITCFQALEHISDLGAVLKEMARILKDDGFLYISVPNADFFEFKLFGAYAYNLEVPRHLYFFKRPAIIKLLNSNGFNNIKFLKYTFFEPVFTPASFYESINYYFSARKIDIYKTVRYLIFAPLIFVRFMSRILLLFEDQNINLVCTKINVSYT